MRFKLCIIAITAAWFGITSPQLAQRMSVTKEALLEKGHMPMATGVIRTHDNGFIVVGTTDHSISSDPHAATSNAMVLRTDSNGNVLWRYVVSDSVDMNGHKTKYARMYPIYSSAVEMPDGSIFVCGTVPSDDKEYGQLTHLDKSGKLIDKQVVLPQGYESSGFDSCIAWGDGFAAVGRAFKPAPNGVNIDASKPYSDTFFDLIAYMDKNGHQSWVKTTPIAMFVGLNYQDPNPLQSVSGGGVVFVRRGDLPRTHIVHVSLDGQIKSQVIKERLMLLRPTGGEGDIQLVSVDNFPLTRIKLGLDLQELNRDVGRVQFDSFTKNTAYRLPDESLVFFGFMFGVGKYPHQQSAAVMKVDSNLQQAKMLSISPAQDSASVDFAAPLSTRGEFVCGRWINPFNRQEDFLAMMQSKVFQALSMTERQEWAKKWTDEAVKRGAFGLDFVETE